MIFPLKPICKKEWVRRDGTSKIFLQYCFNSDERTLVDTDIAIPPAYWDRKHVRISPKLPSEFGSVHELQERLVQKIRKAENILRYAQQKKLHPLKFLKLAFQSDLGLESESKDHYLEPFSNNHRGAHHSSGIASDRALLTEGKVRVKRKNRTEEVATTKEPELFSEIESFIKEKEGLISRKALLAFTGMRDHLLSFQQHRKKPITFQSFTYSFYQEFVKFLTYEIVQKRRKKPIKGLKRNSVGKTITRLTTFLRDRMRKGIVGQINISDYKGMQEEVDHIYISWAELSTIYHLDLSHHPHLEKHRDLFVLGCLTGFRFSDYSEIQPEEVREGMLFIRQAKTNSTVVVPLRPDARAILIDKYQMHMPQVSNVKFNVQIKEIARLTGLTELVKVTHKKGNTILEDIRPKYAWVTSHTCRRSFCTNEYLAGTPMDLIMTVSGHKTEKSFRRYIKADKLQKAQMIQKIWEERPCL